MIFLSIVLVVVSTATLFALLLYEYRPLCGTGALDHNVPTIVAATKQQVASYSPGESSTTVGSNSSKSSTTGSKIQSGPTEQPSPASYTAEGIPVPYPNRDGTESDDEIPEPTEPPSPPSYTAEGIPVGPYPNRDGGESDDEISYLRYLISGMALNNTIIIVPTNLAFARLAINLNCRMRVLGITNALFWALDKGTVEALQAYSIPVYFNPSFYSNEYVEYYHSDGYNQMMRDRPKLWRMVLRTGYNMLFLDADIALLTDPMAELVQDSDLEGQVDELDLFLATNEFTNPQLCGGAFFLKSNERSIRFLDNVEAAIQESWVGLVEDQQAINTIIHNPFYARMVNRFQIEPDGQRKPFGGYQNGPGDDRLTVRFIPTQQYLNGHLWYRYAGHGGGRRIVFEDQGGTIEEFEPALVHLNGLKEKEELLNQSGWWNLQEDMRCSLDKDRGRGRVNNRR